MPIDTPKHTHPSTQQGVGTILHAAHAANPFTAAVQAAAEEAALPILLAEQRSMVEEVDRELQAQQSIVASAEAQNLAKLGALERALRLVERCCWCG